MPGDAVSGHDHASGHRKHHKHALTELQVGLITCSDSRTPDTDTSAQVLRAGLQAAGHAVADYRIVPDDPALITEAVWQIAAGPAQAIITSGGTGVTARDWTFEAISELFTKPLDGFGQLFRMLSWEQVGAAAFLSRATAGLIGETVVFVLPGSPGAAQLAWDKLIGPELGHACWLAVRDRGR